MVQVQCFPHLMTHNTLSRGIVGAKIKHRARILYTYQWIDHCTKVACKKPRKLTRCAVTFLALYDILFLSFLVTWFSLVTWLLSHLIPSWAPMCRNFYCLPFLSLSKSPLFTQIGNLIVPSLLFSFPIVLQTHCLPVRELYCSLLIVQRVKLLSHGSCPHVYKLAYI